MQKHQSKLGEKMCSGDELSPHCFQQIGDCKAFTFLTGLSQVVEIVHRNKPWVRNAVYHSDNGENLVICSADWVPPIGEGGVT